MKLARLIDPKFQAALRKLNAQELPLRTAFKLKGITKKVQEELDKYEEVRQSALQKYGDKDEQGNLRIQEDGAVALSSDGLRAFVLELNELTSLDIELSSIALTELGEKLSLSVDELLLLDGLVVE